MSGRTGRDRLARLWRQLPWFVWLVAVWMLLWGQFTVLAAVTGVLVAVLVTVVFRMPAVEIAGWVSIPHAVVFVAAFLVALVRGSLLVAWQVLDPRRAPGAAVIAVPLVVDDDLIMVHTAVTTSLIPGSLVLDVDRGARVLYLHVIGVRTAADVERHRSGAQRWERRIVRAFGTRAQRNQVRSAEPARGRGGARR